MDAPEATVTVRVDPLTAAIFSALFSPALILGVGLLWRGRALADGLLLCACYVGGVYGICSPAVVLAPGRLAYRSLLGRREIALAGVDSVSVESRPAPTLVLRQGGPGGGSLAFIIKPFSRHGVSAMLQHVRRECPGARFDRVSGDLGRGDFRSVTRQTVSTQNLMRLVIVAAGGAVLAAVVRLLLRG